MDNSEPIPFTCPSCGAKYKVIAIDPPGGPRHGKVAWCDAAFPAGDEHVFFKYVLVGPSSTKEKRR